MPIGISPIAPDLRSADNTENKIKDGKRPAVPQQNPDGSPNSMFYLDKAFNALRDKVKNHDYYFDYYDGAQPVQYASSRLTEVFKGIDPNIFENWAELVIDTLLDRITMTGWKLALDEEEQQPPMSQESQPPTTPNQQQPGQAPGMNPRIPIPVNMPAPPPPPQNQNQPQPNTRNKGQAPAQAQGRGQPSGRNSNQSQSQNPGQDATAQAQDGESENTMTLYHTPPPQPQTEPPDPMQTCLETIWKDRHLNLESEEVHSNALITGESYLIIGLDDKNEPEVYAQDPRLCHIEYAADNPNKKEFAAKWFNGADGRGRVTLYFEDRIEYFVAPKPLGDLETARGFIPDPDQPTASNTWKTIPVFHFRSHLRKVKSELRDIIPIQNHINMLIMNLAVCGEFNSFKQKWIISNASIQKMKNSPGSIWELPASDGMQGSQPTSVGQFEATDLNNYIQVIDELLNHMAAISRLPKHYLLKQGGDPSGAALDTMESPLVKKIMDRLDLFKPTWAEVASFLLKLSGFPDIKASCIEPQFNDPRSNQMLIEAQTVQAYVSAGLPINTTLRKYAGWTQVDFDMMARDRYEAQQRQETNLATAMLNAASRFNSGQVADPNNPNNSNTPPGNNQQNGNQQNGNQQNGNQSGNQNQPPGAGNNLNGNK
jgi:hypothetical protein